MYTLSGFDIRIPLLYIDSPATNSHFSFLFLQIKTILLFFYFLFLFSPNQVFLIFLSIHFSIIPFFTISFLFFFVVQKILSNLNCSVTRSILSHVFCHFHRFLIFFPRCSIHSSIVFHHSSINFIRVILFVY